MGGAGSPPARMSDSFTLALAGDGMESQREDQAADRIPKSFGLSIRSASV